MFERFTESARRIVFFAKYEAANLESPFLEPEHLLLGFLRREQPLAQRFLHSAAELDSTREKVKARQTARDKNPDPPLSQQSKHVLANAAADADTRHQPIAPAHIFLSLLREEKSLAAELLHEHGLTVASVTDELEKLNLLAPTPPPAF